MPRFIKINVEGGKGGVLNVDAISHIIEENNNDCRVYLNTYHTNQYQQYEKDHILLKDSYKSFVAGLLME